AMQTLLELRLDLTVVAVHVERGYENRRSSHDQHDDDSDSDQNLPHSSSLSARSSMCIPDYTPDPYRQEHKGPPDPISSVEMPAGPTKWLQNVSSVCGLVWACAPVLPID